MDKPVIVGDDSLTVTLFEQHTIRRIWHHEEWWYSLVDCMIPLSTTKNKQRYWTDLNIRLKEEMGENYDRIVVLLPLPTKDKKMRKTACANTAGVLRVIQSIKSPKAEPFKLWMAELAARDAIDMERAEYRRMLHDHDVELHALAEQRGVAEETAHERLDNANFRGLYGGLTRHGMMRLRRTPFSGELEDFMGKVELVDNIFQRVHTTAQIKALDLQGGPALNTAAEMVGRALRNMLAELGQPMPEELPPARLISRGDWVPDEQLALIDWETPAEEPDEEATWQVIELYPEPEDDTKE